MFNLNEYINNNRAGRLVRPIVCKSGLKMSVQASETHYCIPRENVGPWVSVEVGFPNKVVNDLLEFGCGDDPTDTVYSYVPVELVEKIVNDNGGLA
jgi:hypothetical protein